MHQLAVIDARPRAVQVRDRIVALIRDSHLKDGDKLPTESQLADMFGVGRSSVRDAMQSLVGLGVIEMRPGRGAFVSRLSLNDVLRMIDGAVHLELGAALQVHEVRAMIEIIAARLAAIRRTDNDLAEMAAALARYGAHDDTSTNEGLIESDLRFHAAIVAATHNAVLVQLYASIAGLLREHRRQYAANAEQDLRATVLSHHQGILQAIEASDVEQATARMQAHMRAIWLQIEQTAVREGDASATGQTYLPMYDESSLKTRE